MHHPLSLLSLLNSLSLSISAFVVDDFPISKVTFLCLLSIISLHISVMFSELLFSQHHQREAHSVFSAPVQHPRTFGPNLRVARLSCSSSVHMSFPNPPPSLLPKIMLDFSEDPTKPPKQ